MVLKDALASFESLKLHLAAAGSAEVTANVQESAVT